MPQALSQRYTGGYLVKNHQLVKEDLFVVKGKIAPPQSRVDQVIPMEGKIIAPGYIDLQINGAFGVDFASSLDNLDAVAASLAQTGVLNYLPTLISSPLEQYRVWKAHYGKQKGALGVHLEGPFLNRDKAGAHPKKMIFPISTEAVLDTLEGATLVTLAPEIPHALPLIKQLTAKGVIVAAGHTLASYTEAEKGFEAGVKLVTHLFNAMTSIHHRHPGIGVATLTHPNVYYTIIADDVHIHPGMVKLAWQTNPKKMILITDAISAMGLEPGLYRLGNQAVEIKAGKATVTGSHKLAGSILKMDQAVRNLRAMTGCSIVDAIEAASLRPAELLGITSRKGTLAIGADADLIFLDENLFVTGHHRSNG